MRKRKENRYEIVDSFRGLTMISMIVYHTIWDLVYIFNINWQWFHSEIVFFWQQSICWTFILISGFCWSFGKRQVKRGCTIFLAGFAITIITMFVMPENRIIFGILTLLGISILLMKQLDPFFIRIHPILGTVLSFSIFLLLRS